MLHQSVVAKCYEWKLVHVNPGWVPTEKWLHCGWMLPECWLSTGQCRMTNGRLLAWCLLEVQLMMDECWMSTIQCWLNAGQVLADYLMTSVETSGERGCWELPNFTTPNDLIPMGHGIKTRTDMYTRWKITQSPERQPLGPQDPLGLRPCESRNPTVASLGTYRTMSMDSCYNTEFSISVLRFGCVKTSSSYVHTHVRLNKDIADISLVRVFLFFSNGGI